MRSALISLQGSVKLLDRTQNRLATGKKVNSALDNPVSFFTSVPLTDRASRLHGLKDTTSEAIRTLKTADRGSAALSTMIEQAKSIAEKALSASSAGAATTTGAITLSGLKADATGGPVTMTVTLSGVQVDNILYLRTLPTTEKPLIADTDYGGFNGNRFKVGADDNETAQNLVHCMNDLVQWDDGFTEYYYCAEYLGGSQARISRYDINAHEQVSVEAGHYRDTSGHFSPALDPLPVLPPDEVTIGGVTFTATTGATAGTSFNVGGTDTENLQ